MSFQAIIARANGDTCVAELASLELSSLPQEPVLVEVSHSALNYKDALAVCGNRNKVMKALPFVPGIDFAGTVVESADGTYAPGDAVLATGWGIGERHWGGFSRYARVKPEWLVRIPQGLTGRHAMALGTAGLTAMLCIDALEAGGIGPDSGEILVTGASGGVGSLAIMLLSALGYQPVASTGRPDQADYFQALGATRIVARSELDRESRPLEKEIWAGAIDTVGGRTLATALAQTRYGGTVAACGLAGDFILPATVMPFILRNVRLQGVDSVYLPAERRTAVWQRLAQLLPGDRLDTIVNEVKLGDVPELAAQMLAGRTRGRSVVVMEH